MTLELERYRDGGCGIPFVHQFDSGIDGPHLMISGVVHGDEPAGMVAVARLVDARVGPHVGRLSLVFANPDAFTAGRRFVDRDLNRLWRDDWIDADRWSLEAARARGLRPLLKDVDYLLDLHTTAYVQRPFFVLADLPRHRALADRMAWPPTQQIMPGGCREGRHLIDYDRFALDDAEPVALTVECGRHNAPESAASAYRVAARFLDCTVGVDPEGPSELAIERYRTVEPYVVTGDDFQLRISRHGFTRVAQGEIVAIDGGRLVRAPFDAVITSCRPSAKPGAVAFIWSREVL